MKYLLIAALMSLGLLLAGCAERSDASQADKRGAKAVPASIEANEVGTAAEDITEAAPAKADDQAACATG